MAAVKALCFLLALGSMLPIAARAHHAVGAFFDTSVPMTIEGILTSMRWQNPHVLLTIESDSGGAGPELWHVESGGPTLLRRLGVTADIAAVGDRVSISGYPSRVHPAGNDRREYRSPGWPVIAHVPHAGGAIRASAAIRCSHHG